MNRPGTPAPVWLSEPHRRATRPLTPDALDPATGALRRARVHCWVRGPDDAPGWWPAVVVQWRRRPPPSQGWSAQVAYVVGGDEPVLVMAWVDAGLLRPA